MLYVGLCRDYVRYVGILRQQEYHLEMSSGNGMETWVLWWILPPVSREQGMQNKRNYYCTLFGNIPSIHSLQSTGKYISGQIPFVT